MKIEHESRTQDIQETQIKLTSVFSQCTVLSKYSRAEQADLIKGDLCTINKQLSDQLYDMYIGVYCKMNRKAV